MEALPIIEHLNVFKDILRRLFTGREDESCHQESFHERDLAIDCLPMKKIYQIEGARQTACVRLLT